MTDKEYKPGRELDFLVAEAIGMRQVEEGTDAWWPSPNMVEMLKEMYPDAIAFDYMAAPHFSTSIAHAWLVIEEAEFWSLESIMSTGKVYASIALPGTMNASAYGDDAMHAICQAALKARKI